MLQLCVDVEHMCIVLCTAQKSNTDYDTCTLNGGCYIYSKLHTCTLNATTVTPTCTHTDHRCICCLCINDHILRMSHVQSANTKLYNM